MRIHIATDHAGLEFSEDLQSHLRAAGHEVIDHGPTSYDPLDDYPSFCINAAIGVVTDQAAGIECLGIVFGGSGNGEVMAANKVPGIRAAYAASIELAELAREHNDAQIISMGGRFTDVETGCAIADAFLATSFSGDERHERRLAMVSRFEADGSLPQD